MKYLVGKIIKILRLQGCALCINNDTQITSKCYRWPIFIIIFIANNNIFMCAALSFEQLWALPRLSGPCDDDNANVLAIAHLGLCVILRAGILPPRTSWSTLSVIFLRTGPNFAHAALLTLLMWPQCISLWAEGSGALSMGQGSMVSAHSSLTNYLNAVHLEGVPPFLLPLVIWATFWKSPCSSSNGISLEGKMQYLLNVTL